MVLKYIFIKFILIIISQIFIIFPTIADQIETKNSFSVPLSFNFLIELSMEGFPYLIPISTFPFVNSFIYVLLPPGAAHKSNTFSFLMGPRV